MADNEVRADRRYTKDHEWAKEEGGVIRIGITSFAVDQLGDITLVNIDVKEGDTLTAGRAFGTIESVKTLSDLFAPISGKVARINKALENNPEIINEDCYEKGWMIEITPSDASEVAGLLDMTGYKDLMTTSAH
jgi:glycine cleavage system H protein